MRGTRVHRLHLRFIRARLMPCLLASIPTNGGRPSIAGSMPWGVWRAIRRPTGRIGRIVVSGVSWRTPRWAAWWHEGAGLEPPIDRCANDAEQIRHCFLRQALCCGRLRPGLDLFYFLLRRSNSNNQRGKRNRCER